MLKLTIQYMTSMNHFLKSLKVIWIVSYLGWQDIYKFYDLYFIVKYPYPANPC